jgi:hypothetical protein
MLFGTSLLGVGPVIGVLLAVFPHFQLGWQMRQPVGARNTPIYND